MNTGLQDTTIGIFNAAEQQKPREAARIVAIKDGFNLILLDGSSATPEIGTEYVVSRGDAHTLVEMRAARLLCIIEPTGREVQPLTKAQAPTVKVEPEREPPAHWHPAFQAEFRFREKRRVAVAKRDAFTAKVTKAAILKGRPGFGAAQTTEQGLDEDALLSEYERAIAVVKNLDATELAVARMKVTDAYAKLTAECNEIVLSLKDRARATFEKQVAPLSEYLTPSGVSGLYRQSAIFHRFDGPFLERSGGNTRTIVWHGQPSIAIDGNLDEIAAHFQGLVEYKTELQAASAELDKIAAGVAKAARKIGGLAS